MRDKVALSKATALGLAISFGISSVGMADEGKTVVRPAAVSAATQHPVVLANEILNRWEPVALAAGEHSDVWRDMYTTQLIRMDAATLGEIDAVVVDAATDPKLNYAKFAHAFKSALMQSYMAGGLSGKGNMKLGPTTTDQAFIPITPCRVVDSRNLLGPILAGFTRNYQFYASTTGFDFGATQGGNSGAAGTVCPGTVNPNGVAPSAAVVTITVVGPTAAGNFVLWEGASPRPTVSVLNWNKAGDIAANTTVVPAGGRTGTGPGGAIQDFAVSYNGPTGQGQVVIDVVGYFVPTAPPVVFSPGTAMTIPAGQCITVFAAGVGPATDAGKVVTGYITDAGGTDPPPDINNLTMFLPGTIFKTSQGGTIGFVQVCNPTTTPKNLPAGWRLIAAVKG